MDGTQGLLFSEPSELFPIQPIGAEVTSSCCLGPRAELLSLRRRIPSIADSSIPLVFHDCGGCARVYRLKPARELSSQSYSFRIILPQIAPNKKHRSNKFTITTATMIPIHAHCLSQGDKSRFNDDIHAPLQMFIITQFVRVLYDVKRLKIQTD
jgi:hypothetical protein